MPSKKPKESEGLERTALGLNTLPVAGVNDELAALVDDFVPTRFELAVLAHHYLNELRQLDYDWIFFRYTGSSEWRMASFVERRLGTIESCLGAEEMREALKDIEEKWGRIFEEAQRKIDRAIPCMKCGKPQRDPHDALWNGDCCLDCS
jgi:hypothetical protein